MPNPSPKKYLSRNKNVKIKIKIKLELKFFIYGLFRWKFGCFRRKFGESFSFRDGFAGILGNRQKFGDVFTGNLGQVLLWMQG